MYDFKKLLEVDIDAVFLDDDIFADEHTINGQKMKAVISNDTLKESSGHWEGGVRQSYGTSIYSKSCTSRHRTSARNPKSETQYRLMEWTCSSKTLMNSRVYM